MMIQRSDVVVLEGSCIRPDHHDLVSKIIGGNITSQHGGIGKHLILSRNAGKRDDKPPEFVYWRRFEGPYSSGRITILHMRGIQPVNLPRHMVNRSAFILETKQGTTYDLILIGHHINMSYGSGCLTQSVKRVS
ncbi:hypothetical protein D3C74_306810 [compost metagenome]